MSAPELDSIFMNTESGQDNIGTVPDLVPKPTALKVAILRAAHQLLDNPVVFEDPLAVKILGTAEEKSLLNNLSQYNTPRLKGLRASLVVRSRLAEDKWTQSQAHGVHQYVILGAGLDTFAYRSQGRDRIRIFEVDLPATQRWKRECLRKAGIEEPPSLVFVPVDFERSTLAEGLRQAAFRGSEPAFFSWLGVTMYIGEEAVMSTLRFIASLAPGSGVVFDYGVLPRLLSSRERSSMELLAAKAAEHGELWKTYFDPSALAPTLRSLGFNLVEEFGPEDLNELYFSGRLDGLRKSGVSRLIHARI
jgi:methyltransferase (TIGR00027 family)